MIDTNFLVVAMVVIMSILGIFPFCFFGSALTTDLQSIGLNAYKLPWYCFHVSHQKNIKFLIKYGQTTRSIEGFGIMKCDLESFLKVKNT